MKFFLDTANLNEIREGAALGIADGVTTNPSLIAKEGDVDFKQHIAAICEIVKGPVSAEVTSEDTEGMLREGREYSKSRQRGGQVSVDSRWIESHVQLSSEGLTSTSLFASRALSYSGCESWGGLLPLLGRLDDTVKTD